MRRTCLWLTLLGWITVPAMAGSVAGKWDVVAGSSYGQSYYLTMNLAESNGRLTGKITTPDGGEVELQNVKMEGDQLSFEVWMGGAGYTAKAKVAANEMTGTWEGGGDSGTVKATRAR